MAKYLDNISFPKNVEKNNQKVEKIRHDKRADETTKNKLLEKMNLALLV